MSMLRRVLDRDSIVKSNLIERLIDCVKELQLKYAADNRGSLTNDESTNTLCWILEAVFIHGLKSPFLKSMSSALSSHRDKLIPEPSFWEFILVFCHQEVIIQINKLHLIHSDIGRCRAWLRLAINDGLLVSYIHMMLKDKSTLKDYYKPTALLRDNERCDILISYLYGIESYEFQLASNSSLLNAWNSGPLSMVGLWTSSNPAESVTQGIDVAQNMESKDLQVLPQMHQGRTPPKPSHFMGEGMYRAPLLEEDEALRVILSSRHSSHDPSPSSSRKTSNTNPPSKGSLQVPSNHAASSTSSERNYYEVTNTSDANVSNDSGEDSTTSSFFDDPVSKVQKPSIPSQVQDASETMTFHEPRAVDVSNTISAKASCKTNPFDLNKEFQEFDSYLRQKSRCENISSSSEPVTIPQTPTDDENLSFTALLCNYNRDQVMGTPIMSSFLKENEDIMTSSLARSSSFEGSPSVEIFELEEPCVPGFEVLSLKLKNDERLCSIMEPDSTLKIAKEIGLDAQNYCCFNCQRPVGMIYGPARVCHFSGKYYCSECHMNEESVIPARMFLNWDFTRYAVSNQAKELISEIEEEPVFDMKKINYQLYDEIEECLEVKNLRRNLSVIVMYLKTCKEFDMEEFKKEIWPKEHLYEAIHTYSLSDMMCIPSRALANTLIKLVTTGKEHIVSCECCQQKGFICEICKDANVIFPFADQIFKCPACGAVYHNHCMNPTTPCPRCMRWKRPYDTNPTFN